MRVIVTGAAGFVGSWVAPTLKERGYEVIGTDKVIAPNVRQVDITDSAEVQSLFKQVRPDAVLHLAAITGTTGRNEVEQSLRQPHLNFTVNSSGTVNICEACRLNGVSKLIYMSSLAVYGKTGPNRLPITEVTEVSLEHAYAASKYMGELAVKAYSEDFGIKSAIFRSPFIAGEGQRERNILKEFIESAVNGGDLLVFGEGKHAREFIHPLDLCNAFDRTFARLGKFENSCELFVLGNKAITTIELANEVIRRVGRGRITYLSSSADRTFDQYTSPAKVEEYLGWRATLGVPQILDRIVSKDFGNKVAQSKSPGK